ncbi:MAG TPA: orotidine-5'-phosphate decarboxylase [Candidatus Dormibacteraeota bacterium]
MSYFDKLRAAARTRGSQLCVGLDPDPERIAGGAEGALRFCTDVVARTAEFACCYKPNSAFWEQYGAAGWAALASLRAAIPDDIPILLDAKRADVGSTMRAYARAAFEAVGADACTVHAYHGEDSLREFTAYADRGVYVVCRTSNPGAADLQHLEAGGRPLYLSVAALAARVNESGNVGLVVGATAPAEIEQVRAASPLPFLVPGVGAQGGDLEASVRAAWTGDEASCLVNVSRDVLYADDPASAARDYRDRINAVLVAAKP